MKAIAAGCDMVLCVNNLQSAVDSVTEAVEDGTLSEAFAFGGREEHRRRLAAEGVAFLPDGRADMEKYLVREDELL